MSKFSSLSNKFKSAVIDYEPMKARPSQELSSLELFHCIYQYTTKVKKKINVEKRKIGK